MGTRIQVRSAKFDLLRSCPGCQSGHLPHRFSLGPRRWLEPAFAEIFRVLKPNRFRVSFHGWSQAERFVWQWKKIGFVPVGHLVFVKDYPSKMAAKRRKKRGAAKPQQRKNSPQKNKKTARENNISSCLGFLRLLAAK
jgi:hypothetical protein